MNKISKGIILTLIMMSGYGYADNMPSLATTGFVQGAYTQLKNEISTAQNKLPTGPSDGDMYRLVWDGKIKGFRFVKDENAKRPTCAEGTYDIGLEQCVSPNTWHGSYGYINDSRGAYGPKSYNTSEYGLFGDQTWGATLSSYGKVTGIASCNDTPGDANDVKNDSFSQTSTGGYCWCKMTSPSVSYWVNDGTFTAETCASDCASLCANATVGMRDFKTVMFQSVGH